MNNGYKKTKMSKRKREFLSIAPGAPLGATVVEGELNYAIQTWKRKVKDSGILKEVFNRREFMKPSVKRRRVKLDAIYKQSKVMG